jgi:hypothetical protein
VSHKPDKALKQAVLALREDARSGQTYTVTLQPLRGADGIRGLRALLRTALRRHRLKAIDIREHTTTRASRRTPAPAVGATQSRRGDTTMDASKFAGSAFLTLDDVKDGPITGEIVDVEEGGYKKLVLTFNNGLRFSLNVTNTQELIKTFGSETDDWLGEKIELYEGEVPYEKKMVPSVRVTPLMREPGQEKKLPPPRPKSTKGGKVGMDDDVPM